VKLLLSFWIPFHFNLLFLTSKLTLKLFTLNWVFDITTVCHPMTIQRQNYFVKYFFLIFLKFRYFEKATKIWPIFHLWFNAIKKTIKSVPKLHEKWTESVKKSKIRPSFNYYYFCFLGYLTTLEFEIGQKNLHIQRMEISSHLYCTLSSSFRCCSHWPQIWRHYR
jgi:hypothetical protein